MQFNIVFMHFKRLIEITNIDIRLNNSKVLNISELYIVYSRLTLVILHVTREIERKYLHCMTC